MAGRGEYTSEIREGIRKTLRDMGIKKWRFARISDDERRVITGNIKRGKEKSSYGISC